MSDCHCNLTFFFVRQELNSLHTTALRQGNPRFVLNIRNKNIHMPEKYSGKREEGNTLAQIMSKGVANKLMCNLKNNSNDTSECKTIG
ncbi:hypothetical protein SDC9_20497 [bioreactor metagenome]|jgi:hypothetical protein|uniref:Uncharacterized protein n=1 Tax=bioreactor metagenome TaxID=1076179 RepID=A0A644U6W0_9ZZZZ